MSREATIGQLKTGEWVLSLCDNYAIWAFEMDTGKCIAETTFDGDFDEGYLDYDIDINGNYDASKPIAFVPSYEDADDFGRECMEGSIWFNAPHPSLPAEVIEKANQVRKRIKCGNWFAREWMPAENYYFTKSGSSDIYKAVVKFNTGEFGVCVSNSSGTPSSTHYYTADGQLISDPPPSSHCTSVRWVPADVSATICLRHPELAQPERATSGKLE